jgi:hypothetical protein
MFWTKVVEKNKTHFVFSNFFLFFFRKWCRLWDNVGKYGRDRQATDDNIIRHKQVTCWITNASGTLRVCKYLLLFHGNNGYANIHQCYVYTYITCLVKDKLAFTQFHNTRSLRYTCNMWNIKIHSREFTQAEQIESLSSWMNAAACVNPHYTSATACVSPHYTNATACVSPHYINATACVSPHYTNATACVDPHYTSATACVNPDLHQRYCLCKSTLHQRCCLCESTLHQRYCLCESTLHQRYCLYKSTLHQRYCLWESTLHRRYCQCESTLHQRYCLCESTLHQRYCLCESTLHQRYCLCESTLHQRYCLCESTLHHITLKYKTKSFIRSITLCCVVWSELYVLCNLQIWVFFSFV